MQGSFSYWRALSEYKKPYATDIGYADQFTNYFANNCNADSTALILNLSGLNLFLSSKGDHDKKSCGKLILVLRDHYKQSEIIRSTEGICLRTSRVLELIFFIIDIP